MQIIPSGTNIDFLGKWKLCVVASTVVIAIGLALAPFRLRWGIDFAGGTEILVRLEPGSQGAEPEIRAAVQEAGVAGPTVVRFGELSEQEFLIRFSGVQGEGEDERQGQIVDQIEAALDQALGRVEVDRVEFVGPRVGAELRSDGLKALGIAGLLILIYISLRFTLRFAPGAVVALLHDVLVTSSLWIMMGREFNLQVLAALLAIVGYSLNDTIIVYDRVRENLELRTARDLPEVINHSVNQTLSRTILTSGTTLLAVLSLLFLGGEVIRPFALAMAIGIVVGTYSSIYIAAPTLLLLEQRYGSSSAKEGASSRSGKSRGKGAARARA